MDAPYRQVELEGYGPLRYREQGQGRPLMFIPGAFATGYLWTHMLPYLQGDYRCILPDMALGAHAQPMPPGADLSPMGQARAILALMDALGLERVTLVGSDTGGALCQLALALAPQRIEALILANCDAFELFPPPALAPLIWAAQVPGVLPPLLWLFRWRGAQRWLAGLLNHYPLTDADLDHFFKPMLTQRGVRRDVQRFLKAVNKRDTLAAAEHFASFDKPVQLIWGEDDKFFFPMKIAQRLKDAFPDARLAVIPQAKTFVQIDQPRLFAHFVDSFLSETADEDIYQPRTTPAAARPV